MSKIIYITSEFFNETLETLEIYNDKNIKQQILDYMKEKYKDMYVNGFDVNFVDEENYRIILNKKGEFLFKVVRGEYNSFFPENVNAKNFEEYIDLDLLYKAIKKKFFEFDQRYFMYKIRFN